MLLPGDPRFPAKHQTNRLSDVYVMAPPPQPSSQPHPPTAGYRPFYMYAVCRFSKKKKITYFVLCFSFVSMYIYTLKVRQTSYIVSKFVIGREVAMAQVCNSCFFLFVAYFVNGVWQIIQQIFIFLWWWWLICCGLTTGTAVSPLLLLIRNVKLSLFPLSFS